MFINIININSKTKRVCFIILILCCMTNLIENIHGQTHNTDIKAHSHAIQLPSKTMKVCDNMIVNDIEGTIKFMWANLVTAYIMFISRMSQIYNNFILTLIEITFRLFCSNVYICFYCCYFCFIMHHRKRSNCA